MTLVTIYSKKNCAWCTKAKKIMRDANISFNEMVLNEDFTSEFIKERFPAARTYPVIILDGYFIGGCQELKEHIATDVDSRKLLNEG